MLNRKYTVAMERSAKAEERIAAAAEKIAASVAAMLRNEKSSWEKASSNSRSGAHADSAKSERKRRE